MTQVYVDPEKLRSFAGELKKFTEVAGNYFDTLPHEMNRLGSTWQDQEYEKFRRDFAPILQAMKRFTEETARIIPQLERDAGEIEEYQRQGK